MEDQTVERSALFRGSPAYEARTPWTPLWALLAATAIISVSILVSILVLGTSFVAGGGAKPAAGQQDMSALATLAIWQTNTVILTLLACLLFGGRVREVLSLRAPRVPRAYLKAVLLMAVLQVFVSAVQYFFFPQDMYSDLRPIVRLFGDQWVLALLVVGLGAPLSEELLFRGFLLSALARSRLGFAGAALVTTFLWTALHAGYSAAGLLEVLLIGLFFSWLLWRTGSLLVPIFCHAFYNTLIVVVLRYVPLPA
jgi:CAAX protease family protein